MKARPVLVGMALALCAGAVFAQPLVSSSAAVIVTATRTARTADDALAAVSVITRADIERRQSQDLIDLLRTQAGIDITRSGGPGGDIALFMRGTDAEHVLVLIDGVRVFSVTNGAFEWRSLPLSQIERIEIVRGPRASLYGSEAIGGVIQIFTRRPKGAEVAVAGGSDNTRRADVAWGTDGSTRAFVTASHFETDGFSAQNERNSPFSFNPDDDGSRMQGVSAGFEARLSNRVRLDVIGRQSRGNTEFDETGIDDQGTIDIDNRSFNARLTHTAASAWTQSLSLGSLDDELVTRPGFPSRIRTKRRTIDWQNDLAFGPGSFITAGLAYFSESGANVDLSTDTTQFDRRQYNRAVYALWQRRFGENDLQLAGRHDDYSTLSGESTWSAAYGRALTGDSRAWVSYGTAFRAPTLNDLHHPGFGGLFAGNPDLTPERSGSAEIGLRQRWRGGHATTISLFSTRVDDLIDFQGPNRQLVNVDKASMRGVELEHRYDAERWRVSNAITLLRARNEVTGNPLVRRADAKLSTLVERRFGWGAVGTEIVAVADRPDVDNNTGAPVTVAGYGIVNIAARYRLQNSLFVEGRVENLFDKEYQIIDGFNTPDRSILITLRYQPVNP